MLSAGIVGWHIALTALELTIFYYFIKLIIRKYYLENKLDILQLQLLFDTYIQIYYVNQLFELDVVVYVWTQNILSNAAKNRNYLIILAKNNERIYRSIEKKTLKILIYGNVTKLPFRYISLFRFIYLLLNVTFFNN